MFFAASHIAEAGLFFGALFYSITCRSCQNNCVLILNDCVLVLKQSLFLDMISFVLFSFKYSRIIQKILDPIINKHTANLTL